MAAPAVSAPGGPASGTPVAADAADAAAPPTTGSSVPGAATPAEGPGPVVLVGVEEPLVVVPPPPTPVDLTPQPASAAAVKKNHSGPSVVYKYEVRALREWHQ